MKNTQRMNWKAILALTLVLALGSCRNSGEKQATDPKTVGETLTLEHQLGTVTVQKNPKRVVALDYVSLENLHELGIEVIGIPKSNLPNYLNQYADKGKVTDLGTLFDVDYELLNELEPDVIFMSTRMETNYAELSKIAPTIFIAQDQDRVLESFEENLDIFGQLFDKEKEVDRAVTRIKAKIGALEEVVSESGSSALIIMHNKGKFSAFGENSRFGIIHSLFGFKQAVEDLDRSRHGQAVSNEFIQAADPDYLFMVDRSAVVNKQATNKEEIENVLVQRTKAYKNGNVVYLDPEAWYISGGGITSLELMIAEVADNFKPNK